MPAAGWILLAVIAALVGVWQYVIHKYIQGPSNCIGCGKCDKTGVCILTGKPVGPRRRKRDGE